MLSPVLVHDFFELSANLYPKKEALICAEERWTYGRLHEACSRLADYFAQIGLGCQDRVALFLDNSAEAVISIYSTLGAGGVFVVVNGSVKARKLEYILRDSGASILVADGAKEAVVMEAAKDIDRLKIIWVGEPPGAARSSYERDFLWKDIFREPFSGALQSGAPRKRQRCIDLDLAALIYTSGSTGEPKGVMSSHVNMVSAARSIMEYLENNGSDRVLNVLPLSFDYGLYQVLMAFMCGSAVVLERSFAYPVRILETIQRERVTGFPIVPTIAALLLKMETLGKYDFSSLRYVTNTGSVLPVDHIRKLRKIFRSAKIYSMYGLTECKRVSYLPPEELDFRPESVGKAIPNCRPFIVDDNGQEVGPGEIGELVVRGANVMRGYWNAPELSEKTFRPGRWAGETLLYSGDLFTRDAEGFLYFVARKDDQIKTKGERVSPREIENIVCELEGVLEAAVIGVEDETLGQAIKCFAVCRAGSSIGAREIIRHCAANMEPFMVPKYVEIISGMPLSAHGKIDKNGLKMFGDGSKSSGERPPGALHPRQSPMAAG
ncbi:MAG: AMP-binding protein [Syntrophobacteraceae bacterium]|nr:AMP-binding protein [Syntrophobacteraceae bacterium]